jgi:RHS repeat-associated protein
LTQQRFGPGGGATSYTYPQAGSPYPHVVTQATTSSPTGTKVNTYGYDEAGNLIERTRHDQTQTLTWDAEGRVESLEDGQGVSEFVYDADGDRLIRRDPTGKTLYLDSTELRYDYATGQQTCTRYYQHLGATVAVRTAAGVSWLVGDHHGTGEVAIRASDMQVQRRRTTPFGELRGQPPASWPGDKGFVGGTDDPSDLTHLGVRLYDNTLGRFVSVGPVIDVFDPQQMHGYAYAGNNPATWSDPTGLCPSCQLVDGMHIGGTISTKPKGGGSPPKPQTSSPSSATKQPCLDMLCRESFADGGGKPSRPTASSSVGGRATFWDPMLSMSQAEVDSRSQVVNDMNVYEALLAFAIGAGGVQRYYQVDEMTMAIRRSGHMSRVRGRLSEIIRRGNYDPSDYVSFRLPYGDDVAAAYRFIADPIAALAGLSGDTEDRMAATVAAIGSYDLTYSVMAVDNASGRAVVAFEAKNIWGLKSLTRIPFGPHAGESVLRGRTEGAMANVEQYWYWTEVIDF